MSARRNRPYMGVQLEESEGALHVAEVVLGTPAKAAGLEAGDRIRSFAGNPVGSR